MPSRHVSTTSERVVPPCQNCQTANSVREIAIDDVSTGIRFWKCDTCSFVWATRLGANLKAIL